MRVAMARSMDAIVDMRDLAGDDRVFAEICRRWVGYLARRSRRTGADDRSSGSAVLQVLARRSEREAAGTSIRTLGLSGETSDVLLFRADVVTVEELTQHTETTLLAVNRLGPKRLAEIRAALARCGKALREVQS